MDETMLNESVLMSIAPRFCQLIASGKKTVEVRKSMPKRLQTPFKCYIYCTYGDGLIEYKDEVLPNHLIEYKVSSNKIWGNCCNGRVIGEFICDKIEVIKKNEVFNASALYSQTCLTPEEYFEYVGNKTSYFWHISNLVMYDKPKELREFEVLCGAFNDNHLSDKCYKCDYYETIAGLTGCLCCGCKPVAKAPQSWCYVREGE